MFIDSVLFCLMFYMENHFGLSVMDLFADLTTFSATRSRVMMASAPSRRRMTSVQRYQLFLFSLAVGKCDIAVFNYVRSHLLAYMFIQDLLVC